MKPADRFRVLEALHAIAREHVRVSVAGQALTLSPASGHEVTAYARSLCRELTEAYQGEPEAVRGMIAARRAA
jgi:hypothetical protein